MTNAPDAPDRIARSQVLLGFASPLAVTAGDAIDVKVKIRHDDLIISWTAHNPRTGQRERQSTFASMPMSTGQRLATPNGSPHLNPEGQARAALLALVDGTRSSEEIEAEMLVAHSTVFPSETELVRFVRTELARSAT